MREFEEKVQTFFNEKCKNSIQSDLRDELVEHFRLACDSGIEAGLSPDEAWNAATENFGDLEKIHKELERIHRQSFFNLFCKLGLAVSFLLFISGDYFIEISMLLIGTGFLGGMILLPASGTLYFFEWARKRILKEDKSDLALLHRALCRGGMLFALVCMTFMWTPHWQFLPWLGDFQFSWKECLMALCWCAVFSRSNTWLCSALFVSVSSMISIWAYFGVAPNGTEVFTLLPKYGWNTSLGITLFVFLLGTIVVGLPKLRRSLNRLTVLSMLLIQLSWIYSFGNYAWNFPVGSIFVPIVAWGAILVVLNRDPARWEHVSA